MKRATSRHAGRLVGLACLAIISGVIKPVQAEGYYSVTSLTLLCGTKDPHVEEACIAYLHGVVETWVLKDVVSLKPPFRYSSPNREPTFCETINKVSDREWLSIVRSNLNTMEPGLAADAVMQVLSTKLCK